VVLPFWSQVFLNYRADRRSRRWSQIVPVGSAAEFVVQYAPPTIAHSFVNRKARYGSPLGLLAEFPELIRVSRVSTEEPVSQLQRLAGREFRQTTSDFRVYGSN
jgi:hypothetical protein